jgi:ectoine hydroxylase-related dioxygenase (phytanoyl-CoA dioxygenase family)
MFENREKLKMTEIQKLQQDGFCVIENFFSRETIDDVLKSIEKVIEGVIESAGLRAREYIDQRDEVDETIVRLIATNPKLQPILYDRLQQMPALLAFPGKSSIITIASEILESSRIGVWPRTQLRMDLPGDEENVINWHNDYIYNGGTVDSYTFWFPLVSLNEDMGYIDFAKGSHLLTEDIRYQMAGPEKKFKITIPDDQKHKLNIVTPKPAVGDLVIFHCKTWHTGKLNKSKKNARLSGLFRMQNLNKLEIKDGK